jgi:hypothetical protein
MRVLGVVPTSTDLKWAIVEGQHSSPTLVATPTKTQKLPVDEDQCQVLQGLYRLVSTFLKEQSVEKVCVLQAGNSKFGGPSSARIKAEAIFQLVGADLSIPTELVPPQTLRAAEKKFTDQTGGTPESVFNDGDDFVPKPWRDAVLVAWVGLEA